MLRRASIVLLALLTLATLPGSALAHEQRRHDPDLPLIDRPGTWRLMTHDAETTDSQCVGDPKTALCAIETILACFVRRNNDLCRIGQADPMLPELVFGKPIPTNFDKYRVVSVKKERLRGTPGINLDGSHRPAVYTRLFVDMEIRPCWVIDGMVCGGHDVPTTYEVIKLNGRWRVFNWFTPRY